MQLKPDKQQQEQLNQKAILIHDVFVKNEKGAKLLEEWKQILIFSSGHTYGKDLYDLGRMEGEKDFVRGILVAIEKAEGK